MTPTHAPTPARTRRTPGDIVRGIGAVIALATFVIGVPLALVAVAPWPDLARLASLDAVIAALTRPDDGTLLLGVILVIAWAAWAAFTITVLTELAAVARHATAPRLPLLGGMQRLATTLVTAAGLLVVSSAPSISTIALGAPSVVTASSVPTTDAPVPAEAAASAPAPSRSNAATPSPAVGPSVTVQRGDTLWDLAERHLGDGHRYTEILDLNLGRTQADGRALDDAHWVFPGWQLHLPDDATALDQPAAAANGTTDTYTVQPGDTLWDIAADHLGDSTRYPEIVDLNHAIPQPDGGVLVDPDVIEPGWSLTLPRSDDAPAPAPPVVASLAVPDVDHPAPRDIAPPVTDDPIVALDDGSVPADDATPLTDDAHEVPDDADDESSHRAFYLGFTGLAAAGVIGEIARRRKLQQRVRRTGERIALPAVGSPAHAAERILRAAAPSLTIPTLKRALLNLASRCYTAERDLPRLAAITLTPTDVVLHLTDDDATPVVPFTAIDARTWAAPATAVSDDPGIDDLGRPEPYPALVTLGHTTDGTVLLNLEATGTLTLTGDPNAGGDVLRALVAELATSDLTGRIGLIAGEEYAALAAACDRARLRTATPESLTAWITGRSADVARTLRDAGVDDTLQARSDRVVDDAWLPVVYVAPGSVADAGPWSGSTVIGLGQPAQHGWTLHVDDDAADLGPLGLTIRPQRLSEPDLDALVELLATANPARHADRLPESVPVEVEITEALTALPEPPISAPLAAASVPLRINVLGPIALEGPAIDGAAPLSPRSTELLVYLALRGQATGPELEEALWNGRRVENQTRNSLVYRTRQRVGADVLPVVGPDGIYRLGPTVTCDWVEFQAHAHRGLTAGPDGHDDLQAALDLVRDRPLLGIRDRDYTWAEYDIQHMISAIADVAHVTAQLHASRGTHRTAIETATKGLLADPTSETLHADAIAAATSADDHAEARRLRDRLQAMATDLDPEYV